MSKSEKKILYSRILQGDNERDRDALSQRNTCLVINSVFAGIIMIVFFYSGFFDPEKDNYPLVCIHEKVTGQPCPSCGMSRSFSCLIRGEPEKAVMFNEYGPRVFLFFLFHLVMRISNIVVVLRKPQFIRELILIDSVLAVITFILAFRQFFEYYIRLIF